MKKKSAHDGKAIPYLFAHYDLHPLHALKLSNVRYFLARTYNSLVNSLNSFKEQPHLPQYILVILDTDIIKNAQVFNYGVTCTFEDPIKWLLINFNRVIKTRKDEMMGKQPGSVSSSLEPRMIWVMSVHRPDGSTNREIYSLCRKFNTILEDVIAGDKR